MTTEGRRIAKGMDAMNDAHTDLLHTIVKRDGDKVRFEYTEDQHAHWCAVLISNPVGPVPRYWRVVECGRVRGEARANASRSMIKKIVQEARFLLKATDIHAGMGWYYGL